MILDTGPWLVVCNRAAAVIYLLLKLAIFAKVFFHRPHPGKEALRYRVQQAREFLNHIGVKP